MKRMLLLATFCTAAVLMLSPVASAQSGVQGPACAELGDSGEQAQQEAQALLNQDPSDPNGLDADDDGIPCEFTESAGQISYEDGSMIFIYKNASPQNGDTAEQEDLDCSDFASQAEAQAALREDPSDPYGLDGPAGPVGTGEPGVACEGALPGPADFTPVANEGLVPGSGVTTVTSIADQSAPVVEEDGSISLASDVGTECRSFAFSVEQGYDLGLTQGQIQSVLEQCRSAGFLPSAPVSDQYDNDNVTAPTPQPSTPVEGPATGPSDISELPDTGGATGLAWVAGALLLGGGLMVRRIIR